jgi:hypothetical protein
MESAALTGKLGVHRDHLVAYVLSVQPAYPQQREARTGETA